MLGIMLDPENADTKHDARSLIWHSKMFLSTLLPSL